MVSPAPPSCPCLSWPPSSVLLLSDVFPCWFRLNTLWAATTHPKCAFLLPVVGIWSPTCRGSRLWLFLLQFWSSELVTMTSDVSILRTAWSLQESFEPFGLSSLEIYHAAVCIKPNIFLLCKFRMYTVTHLSIIVQWSRHFLNLIFF